MAETEQVLVVASLPVAEVVPLVQDTIGEAISSEFPAQVVMAVQVTPRGLEFEELTEVIMAILTSPMAWDSVVIQAGHPAAVEAVVKAGLGRLDLVDREGPARRLALRMPETGLRPPDTAVVEAVAVETPLIALRELAALEVLD